MTSNKIYRSFRDFERQEYLRVISFYENLEDIMDDEFFSKYEEVPTRMKAETDMPEELEF